MQKLLSFFVVVKVESHLRSREVKFWKKSFIHKNFIKKVLLKFCIICISQVGLVRIQTLLLTSCRVERSCEVSRVHWLKVHMITSRKAWLLLYWVCRSVKLWAHNVTCKELEIRTFHLISPQSKHFLFFIFFYEVLTKVHHTLLSKTWNIDDKETNVNFLVFMIVCIGILVYRSLIWWLQGGAVSKFPLDPLLYYTDILPTCLLCLICIFYYLFFLHEIYIWCQQQHRMD